MFDLSRRSFLKGSGTVGVIGASQRLFPSWMPKLAFQPNFQSATNRDVLVCIFLRGGMDGISAIVPYGDGKEYYDVRPTLSVPEPDSGANAAIDLDGYFGLHPAMSPLKEVYDENDLAIVHATGLTDGTRSHFDAMLYMEYGTPGEKSIGTGWIGRHLQTASWQNDSPFRAVGMGAMIPTSLRGPVSPLSIKSITDFHFKGREDEAEKLRQSLSSLYAFHDPSGTLDSQANLVWETIDLLQSLSATDYAPARNANYPDNEFGMGLRQIAQLIKAGVGLEVATLDIGGWDTHEYQGTFGGTFEYLVMDLAQGLHAFYADLGDYMHNTTVVTMSEFGRTVDENGSNGTDHGHGNVMFLMGGGVRGGQVYADWPTLAPHARDADDDLAITTDYRDVLAEVLTQRVGNNAVDQIFPNHQVKRLGLVEQV